MPSIGDDSTCPAQNINSREGDVKTHFNFFILVSIMVLGLCASAGATDLNAVKTCIESCSAGDAACVGRCVQNNGTTHSVLSTLGKPTVTECLESCRRLQIAVDQCCNREDPPAGCAPCTEEDKIFWQEVIANCCDSCVSH